MTAGAQSRGLNELNREFRGIARRLRDDISGWVPLGGSLSLSLSLCLSKTGEVVVIHWKVQDMGIM